MLNLKTDKMKTQEIIDHVDFCNYMFSDNDAETLNFFEQAVKKTPEFIKKEVLELVAYSKQDKDFNCEEFTFAKEYKEIFAPLNIDVKYED